MKKLLLIFIFSGLFSCKNNYEPQPPYVIVGKLKKDTIWQFYYLDKNGYTLTFEQSADEYQIGDTIKP